MYRPYFIFPSDTGLSKRTSLLIYSMATVNIYALLLSPRWMAHAADVLTEINSEPTFLTVLE